MRRICALLLFLFSGIAIAQTTVTLEDQCNCEVLSGPDVTAPGMTTPTGADTGDIYVNTNTGTIYFWDGNSWELTSSDNQQLQGFTFDSLTGELRLTLENGGTSSIILPLETLTTMTGVAPVGNAIGIYENENGDLVTINETITSMTDNGDGNVTLVNEAGATMTVAKSDITANPDGTYTFTNNDGTDVTIDTNGIEITNVIPGNRIATVTEADGTTVDIDETVTDITGTSVTGNEIGVYQKEDGTTVSIQETITSMTDNGDGNVTLVNEAGATMTVAKSDITANPDGTYTFTNNDGTDVTIDTNGIEITNVIPGNRIATVTEADGTTVDIDETITTLSTLDGVNFTYTSEDGTPTVFDGTDDQDASEVNLTNPIDVDGDTIDESTVEEAIADLANNSSDNQDLTGATLSGLNELQIDIEDGNSATVDLSSLSETVTAGTGAVTVTDDGNGNYTVNSTDLDEDLTNELTLIGSGAPAVTPSNAGVTYVDDVAGQLYVWDGAAWNQVGGNASPDLDGDPNNEFQTLSQLGTDVTLSDGGGTISVADNDDDPNNEIQDLSYNPATQILNITNNATATDIDLSGLDTDTQYTAGTGLNLVGTEFSADPSLATDAEVAAAVAASDALDLDKVIGNESVTGLTFDGGTSVLTLTQDGAANQTVNLGALDTDTQYTAGDGLNLDGSNEFTAVASPDAGNATEVRANGIFSTDDQDASEVSYDGSVTGLGGDVQAAIDNLAGQVDDDVSVTNTITGNRIATISEPGITPVDIEETITTLDTVDSETYTYRSENGTETSFDGTDDQDASQVNLATPVDIDGDSSDETTVEEAITALAASSSDNQQISGSVTTPNELVNIALERGGSTNIDIRDGDSDDTNEIQDASEVSFDNSATSLTGSTVQAALEELDGNIGSSELTTTVSEGNGVDIVSSTSGNNTDYEVTVNVGELTGDGNVTSTNATIDITGGNASTLNDVTLDVADNAITNAKMADNAITTTEILDGTIGTLDIANDAVTLGKLADGTALGQVMQWDGANWTLVDLGSVTVTENDGVIGNEVVGPSNGTLTLTGAGDTVDPFRLEVTADGITGNEIATGAVGTDELSDSAVTLGKLADGSNAGDLIQWNGTAWTYIDPSTLDTDTQDLSIDASGTTISLVDGGSVTINPDDAD
uniref:beta strand repeat-containing protein n=1 Tax=Pareuzebyella sediminis TaxID=2607998 RepID=UPI0011EE6FC8